MKRLLLLLLLMTTCTIHAGAPVILVLGDSLSAGHGIDQRRGWVALLQPLLQQAGYPHRVVNASISGDTSAGGLERLPPALTRLRPEILVIELGANDGLRGQSLARLHDNLERMIQLGRQAGSRVLLMEMRLPSNLGRPYTEKFRQIYWDLSRSEQVPLVPFFLDGVADRPELMQEDRLHPNAAAQARMLDNVWPLLEPLLTQGAASG